MEPVEPASAEAVTDAWVGELDEARGEAEDDEEALEIASEAFMERPDAEVLYRYYVGQVAQLRGQVMDTMDHLERSFSASPEAIEVMRDAWARK